MVRLYGLDFRAKQTKKALTVLEQELSWVLVEGHRGLAVLKVHLDEDHNTHDLESGLYQVAVGIGCCTAEASVIQDNFYCYWGLFQISRFQ